MTCPICGGKTYITDSRPECDAVHRKRVCKECSHVFFTTEMESVSSEDLRRMHREQWHERRKKK